MSKTFIEEFCDERGIDYTITADGLVIVHGYLDLEGFGHDFSAPNLQQTGNLYLRGFGHDFSAPNLQQTGSLYLGGFGHDFSAPNLQQTGNLYLEGFGHDFSAPNLLNSGGVYYTGNLFGCEFKVMDGEPSIVLYKKQRGAVTIYHCRSTKMTDGEFKGEKFFVASQDGKNAHGKTIKEALEELAFKTDDRDVSQYKNMPPDTTKTPKEWAFAYRMITGACQYGTNSFMSRHKLKKQYTLAEIIEATKGAYGHDRFIAVVGKP